MEYELIHEQGKYTSPFEGYPGYIQLPWPFLGRHYKKWLRETRRDEGKKDSTSIEQLPIFLEWKAAVTVVDFYLENVSAHDLSPEGDDAPVMVQTWVRECVAEYLAEQLNLKN